jgi:hypothetical protein
MTGIFINYRTGDETFASAAIDQRLRAEFGDDRVFRDSRALPAGLSFPSELWRRLQSSTVMLALIGPRWLTLTDDDGQRRLDVPDDYVRLEIRVALEKDKTVIPVLVGGAGMPARADLPDDIKDLRERQYLEVRSRYYDVDVDHLVDVLAGYVPTRTPAAPVGGNSSVNIHGAGSMQFNGPIAGRDVHGG